jgi:hypothetical protein
MQKIDIDVIFIFIFGLYHRFNLVWDQFWHQIVSAPPDRSCGGSNRDHLSAPITTESTND